MKQEFTVGTETDATKCNRGNEFGGILAGEKYENGTFQFSLYSFVILLQASSRLQINNFWDGCAHCTSLTDVNHDQMHFKALYL